MAEEKQNYTAEEKAAWLAERKAEVNNLRGQAEQGMKDVLDHGQLPSYLRMMAKMPGYDYRNTMLVMLQNPGATYPKSAKQWNKNFGRRIDEGETSIKILIPKEYMKTALINVIDKTTGLAVRDVKGNIVKQNQKIPCMEDQIVHVFDVTQTNGKAFVPPAHEKMITGDERDFTTTMKALERTSPVPIKFQSMKGDEKGVFDRKKNDITICKGMTEAETVDTTIKCMAAAVVHQYDMKHPERAAQRDPRLSEIQTQSIAFVTCNRLGLDTSQYQFPETKDWSVSIDMKDIKATMNGICATAGSMSHDISKGMEKERTREQVKDRSKTNTTHQDEKKQSQGITR